LADQDRLRRPRSCARFAGRSRRRPQRARGELRRL